MEDQEPKPKVTVRMSPQFIEQLSTMTPELRDQLMEAMKEFKEDITRNPHMGTPLDQGFLKNRTFRNWIARKWVDLQLKVKHGR